MVSAMRRASRRRGFGDRRRHPRRFQNVIAVLVLGDVETFHRAVVGARRHHRDLALERHEGFEDAGLAADVAPGRHRIGAVLDGGVALAVIAEAARFQDRGPADAFDRSRERLGRADIGKCGGADSRVR